MKIVALRLDEFGVGSYRVTNPLMELTQRGHTCRIIQAEYGLRMNSHWFVGDILLCQRMNDPVIYRLVESIPPEQRPVVVYEIDDLLWDDPVPKQGREIAADWQRTVPPMIKQAGAVVCTTPDLARRCEALNPRVYVARNGIDFGLRDWNAKLKRPPEAEGKVVIGWSGSGWHEGDLDVIGKALRRLMLRYPQTFLLLQGDAPNIVLWVQGLRIPAKRMAIIDWMPLDEHPAVYSLFDIGIAPLANTPYNRCKSELKLMELGARSVPYVASSVAPYRRFHNQSQGKCGFLVSDECQWFNALETLVLMETERRARGAEGLKFVKREYTLEKQADELEWALKDILKYDNPRPLHSAVQHSTQH